MYMRRRTDGQRHTSHMGAKLDRNLGYHVIVRVKQTKPTCTDRIGIASDRLTVGGGSTRR